MSALVFGLFIGMALITIGAVLVAWYCLAELDRLEGEHAALRRVRAAKGRASALLRAAPPVQRHSGHHVRRPFTVPISLLNAEDTAKHALAMYQASAEYLPPPPEGQHPYPWEPADRPAVVVASMLPARNLTGPMTALTDAQLAVEAAQEKRAQLTRFMLRDLASQHDDGQPTRDDMEYALAALRAVPVPDPYAEPPAASTPAYGQVPVAEVLESERLAGVMQQ